MSKTFEVLLVGNPTHDVIIKGGKEYQKLGGSVSYISNILAALSIRFGVVSKVGNDFLYNSEIPFNPIVTNGPSTCFVNSYKGKERAQRVKSVGEKIGPGDIKSGARIAIVSGVIGEFLPETIRKLKVVSDIVMCDAQGLIRVLDEEGNVYHKNLLDTEFKDVLECIDFLKVGRDELKNVDLGLSESMVILLTQGDRGCTIIKAGKRIHAPTKAIQEVEPTGAGDMFLGGFACGLLKGKDLETCARLGNYFGGIAVSSVGIPKINIRGVEHG